MSDVMATTQTLGVAGDAEGQFQGLWDSGAFDPNGIPPKEGNEGTASQQDNTQQQSRQEEPRLENEDGEQQGQEQQTQQTEEEAPAYESLDALLTSLKIDPKSVMNLNVTTKIDGVETQVPLEQVLKSYQLEGHVNNKSIELSNQRTQFETERQNWRQAANNALQTHQQMAQVAMQMLNHDFNQVNWDALRAQNPGEYAALYTQYQQRQGQIQGFLQNVQAMQAQESQQQQAQLQQNIAAERQRMLDTIPEWRDNATFTKDRDQISQYARNLGFQDAELNQIYDHRYMRILNDAARYQALQAAKPAVLKQVRQAPKTVAPGSRTETNPSDARRQAAVDRFNRNPRDEDAQAAVFSLFSD